MQAVIKAGGNQYIVAKDQIIELDLLDTEKKSVEFDALMTIDGDKVVVGTPVVPKVRVKAEVTGQIKGDKIKVLKFKPKKRIKTLTGHRQQYTQVKITNIG